ncbi:uncharacterized protein LOC134855054 [Symsagittifera roscoffensis]|uniref:uncharacterized protein LOC134855054 n=1 Tax=Symsagittifera roscoffensis TaxID=84072 RepID=UPI00307CB5F3
MQVWHNAVIIPLLKSGKPASSIESYRPVSLTSCIVKLLERMIFHRLYNLAESRGMLCHTQAGCRKNRSCEDQLIRISQNISDGFQERKPKRTVMALLDLSRAYDRVWKEDLLLCLFESGVPLSFIRWIWAFLRNDNSASCLMVASAELVGWSTESRKVQSNVIPKDVLNSIFADDLTIWASDRNKETAQWRVQEAVKHIESWCHSKKMLFSDKSSVTSFSTASCDAKWVPSLNMNNLPMKFDQAPKLLGLYMNRTLSFQQHPALATLAGDGRSAPCAASTWQHSAAYWTTPPLPGSRGLERAQNQVLCRITGQTASSPVEALRIEAGLPSYETTSRQLIATSSEKAFRRPPNHPRRLALEGEQRHRLCRDSWRENSKKLEASLPEGLTPREPLAGPTEYLWTANPRKWTVSSTLVGGNRTDNARTDAIRVIRESEAQWVIYTDESASEGTHFGGSAMVVTEGDPENPVTIDKIKTKGRIITSSYEEEKEAMDSAIKWLEKNTIEEHDKLLICTDFQSLTAALDNKSPDVASLCRRLDAMDRHINIQCVPTKSPTNLPMKPQNWKTTPNLQA